MRASKSARALFTCRSSNWHPVIFSDLDGTLLSSSHSLTDRTVGCLQRYRDAGGLVVYITGRSEAAVRRVFDGCAFTADLWITQNGGRIYRPDGAPSHGALDATLPNGHGEDFGLAGTEARRWAKAFLRAVPQLSMLAKDTVSAAGLQAQSVVTDEREFLALLDECHHGLAQSSYPNGQGLTKPEGGETVADRISTVHPQSRLLMWVRGWSQPKLRAALLGGLTNGEKAELAEHRLANSGLVSSADGTGAMELSPTNTGKRFAMESVCARLGLDAARDACAFGDGENDVEMLGAAHRSVAPSNAASARVRELVSCVRAETNDDLNAVAAELEAWLEDRPPSARLRKRVREAARSPGA